MGIPKPSAQGERGTPFLKANAIGPKGTKGVVTFAGEPREADGEYGPQIIVPVTCKGKRYDWAFGVNSGNHRRLYDRFGDKTPKGTAKVEVKEGVSGNPYVALSD